jgi:hypothetical protein
MPHSFKLSRRIARFRAPAAVALLLSLAACNDDSFNPDRSATPDPVDQVPAVASDGEIQAVPVGGPELATSFAGGIPIGTFHQPNSEFGSRYNGALRNDWPTYLADNLSTIRARGGKVMLMMVGQQKYYKNADGTFSLSKWKARVDRYRKVNLSSFINDGTVIGHYLIDEPYDPANWAGRPISGATLEEMAKYSKSIWPSMKTIVRAEPYLIKWSGTYRALDAAWAQYLWRKGNPKDYLDRNVSVAKQMGLGLVVGLNLLKGGQPNGTWMTPSEVENWGSALLSSDYVCAFISWQYTSDKLNNSAMRDAMSALRRKAENHSSRSCSG